MRPKQLFCVRYRPFEDKTRYCEARFYTDYEAFYFWHFCDSQDALPVLYKL